MIHVLASIRVKESCREDFLKIFTANIPAVLVEEGCIEYIPTVDFQTDFPPQLIDANTVTIIEKWESYQTLQAHLAAPHMLTYKSAVQDLVEGVSLKILQST